MRYLYSISFLVFASLMLFSVYLYMELPHLFLRMSVYLCISLVGAFFAFVFSLRNLFKSGHEFKYFSNFWAFIFNDLPPKSGKTYDPVAHLLIIYENYSEVFNFICDIDEVYKDSEGLKIKLFKADLEQDESISRKILKYELESAQAIVICRSKLIEEKSWIYNVVDNWASKSSEYPILVVDFLNSDDEIKLKVDDKLSAIPFKYDFTKLTKPSELPWRFLSRSNERGHLWKNQANSNRNIAMAFSAVAFLLLLFISQLRVQNRNTMIDLVDSIAQTSSDGLEYVLRAENVPHFDMQKYLCKYSDIMLSKFLLQNDIEYTEESFEVSLWNSSFVDSTEICYQLGWSNRKRENDAYDLFELGNTSIISCAYENPNKVVYWNSNDNGAATVYPVEAIEDGEGRLEDIADKMFVILNNGDTCSYFKQETSLHKAVICYHYDDKISPEVDRGAICISSKTNMNQFLRNKTSANFLRNIGEVITSINKNHLIPPDLEERYKKKQSEEKR